MANGTLKTQVRIAEKDVEFTPHSNVTYNIHTTSDVGGKIIGAVSQNTLITGIGSSNNHRIYNISNSGSMNIAPQSAITLKCLVLMGG